MDQENVDHSHGNGSSSLLSPPPSSPPSSSFSTKIRKPPPITPRRFTKFFTPRNLDSGRRSSKAGRTLRDITYNASNSLSFDLHGDSRPSKRRRLSSTACAEPLSPRSNYSDPFASSPPPSSPCQNLASEHIPRTLRRIQRTPLVSSFAPSTQQTSDFCSGPEDVHELAAPHLPFCVEACNTNSLVAIGTEAGYVHMVESCQAGKSSFSDSFLTFQPHDNAIMDLAFSHNDHYLATASGDQTGRIIDMFTQRATFVLDQHTYSIKHISFLPGSDKIVATCGRDGIVGLWDTRCRSSSGPVYRNSSNVSDAANNLPRIAMYNYIVNAHVSSPSMTTRNSTGRQPTRQANPSQPPAITCLTFLPGARGGGNLFLTSCADSAQLRLWDVRGKYSTRRGDPVPISTTAPISTHANHRSFGVNSMSLSTDASRLFAVCRDSTVYAYSTNHIMLGQANELNASDSKDRGRWCRSGAVGAGPLYGMRHPNFRAGSFYVKSSMRKASVDRAEVLAVGSSDSTPVLFSTDESYLQGKHQRNCGAGYQDAITSHLTHPTLAYSSPVSFGSSGRPSDVGDGGQVPIYTTGTPLVRGHATEVSGVSWTTEGELVTIGDDYHARIWRENGPRARALRVDGEGQGQRWKSGWAELDDAEFDEDDG